MHGHKEVVEFLITAGAYVFNEQNAPKTSELTNIYLYLLLGQDFFKMNFFTVMN